MKAVIQKIEKTEEVLCVIMLMLMCLFIFLGTVSRFTGMFIISWAEELSACCGQHFMVNAIGLFCPPSVVRISQILCAFLVAAFSLLCVIYGFDVLLWQINANQITATLHWPMWLMYLSIPLGLALMAICYCYHTYEIITGKVDIKQEGGM